MRRRLREREREGQIAGRGEYHEVGRSRKKKNEKTRETQEEQRHQSDNLGKRNGNKEQCL